MSHVFVPVQWNRQKRIYDLVAVAAVVVFLTAFVVAGSVAKVADPVILALRGLGATAFVLLHIVLAIGPLARLTDRAKPLLYNRRHLGVMTALIATAHGALALIWYGGSGVIDPITQTLGGYGSYLSAAEFPFEALGLIALLVLWVMAATSHDFWLAKLSPPVWKWLHMSVYAAYALLVAHVVLGTAQVPGGSPLIAAVAVGALALCALHVAAAFRSRYPVSPQSQGWLDAGPVDAIPMDRAVSVQPPSGERIAVFRSQAGVSAIAAVCAHQNGPLDEGCIRAGLVTCPWHGFQFDPVTGLSPPPFTDSVPSYDVRVVEGRAWVSPTANPDRA